MESSLYAVQWCRHHWDGPTPCGINGILTGRRLAHRGRAQCAQRLAASMESSLVPGAVVLVQQSGAQRLAASMESSLERIAARMSSRRGAQRLAASMESSHNERSWPPMNSEVLNALRHQWNPHYVMEVG